MEEIYFFHFSKLIAIPLFRYLYKLYHPHLFFKIKGGGLKRILTEHGNKNPEKLIIKLFIFLLF
ncbi:MAG: hypothetical protein ACD_12C00327G0001 [uncultured bacterium]|nr:MAG: hypothetical protein ACD_12C00327G0001 [uncultured bacterium]